MNYQTITHDGVTYLETRSGDRLESEQDALDLVAACGENGTHLLMVYAEQLDDEFFRLSSGLAGAVMLKFGNYGIRWAAVLTPERVGRGRFWEMVLEANRGDEFRVFYDRSSAEKWLVDGEK